MSNSNKDKWDFIYLEEDKPISYGDETTYMKGYQFLKDCDKIEDWGCGFGFMSTVVPKEKYVGIDGSCSKFATVNADLAEYKSQTEGLFMRHILEHNFQWKDVLKNALDSFTKKMVLVIFTPFAEETKQIAWNELHGVPDISFLKEDLTNQFKDLKCTEELNIKTGSQYGEEHIFYLERP